MTSSRKGYACAVLAALLFCGNGVTSRLLLDDGITAGQLSELRAAATFLCLLIWALLRRREALRVPAADVPWLLWFGLVGIALTNVAYFVAIRRLGVGVGLTLEYLGPIMLLCWLRVRYRRTVAARVWLAALLAFSGCMLVVRGWDYDQLDLVGVAAGLMAAVGFASYSWGAERSGHSHGPLTTLLWFTGASTPMWLAVVPPTSISLAAIDSPTRAAALAYVCIAGTLGGFGAAFAAVRHIPAARASVVMTLEPALAALIAWPVLGETLSPIQLAGGAVVLGAVGWIQTQRQAGPEEQAPPLPGATAAVHR